MPLLRFVHAADLHLDSPFTGLKAAAPDNVANALYAATFTAYENIIDLCIDEGVDALLVAGDVYDGKDRSLRAQLKFVEGLRRLDEAGIRSFVCHGNHDPLDGWEAKLNYPPGCKRFGRDVRGGAGIRGRPATRSRARHQLPDARRLRQSGPPRRQGRSQHVLHRPDARERGRQHRPRSVRPVFAGRPRVLRHRLLGARPRSHSTGTQRSVADRGSIQAIPRAGTPTSPARAASTSSTWTTMEPSTSTSSPWTPFAGSG